MNSWPGADRQADGLQISVLEGLTVGPAPRVADARSAGSRHRYALRGHDGLIVFDEKALSKHVLFLGSIGTGKTGAMMQLVQELRANSGPDDVFVIFDTKDDFRREFYRDGDAVIASDPASVPGGVIWNLFRDLAEADGSVSTDQIHEIAATVFSQEQATENAFFITAASDIFAAIVGIMAGEPGRHSNADLRQKLEQDSFRLHDLIAGHADLAGTARYLEGERTPEEILAFLQQRLNSSFAGAFRLPGGDFSIRDFVRRKAGRALFIEYDIAIGSRLLPVYRVLMDMAIKEALSLGRRRGGPAGSVYFVLDEFALLPQLSHIGDGINFGRSLGLKFLVATQNVNQVLHAYGVQEGSSMLSGFGTAFAFRLMDSASRDLVRQRFGANRKQVSTFAAVRSQGVQQVVIAGNVIEDWHVSDLRPGECVVSLPAGPPFSFRCLEYPAGRGAGISADEARLGEGRG